MEASSRLSYRARRGLRFRRRTDGHTSWLQWLRARPWMKRSSKIAATALGAVLIWASLAFVGYATGWTIHKHRANSVLVAQVHTPAQPGAACVEATPQQGQLAGVIEVASLSLTAPVEQGTDDAELNVAAGHAPASVWPGQNGTSVMLAHDVSYFVHLGDLKPGDLITYRNQCQRWTFQVTGSKVVNAGDDIFNSATPTLVLDTCWPTNALFYTSQRLLVSAALVANPPAPASKPAKKGSTTTTTTSPLQAPGIATVNYTTPAPPALVAQGLTLDQNSTPMGTMTLTGSTSQAFQQSPNPLGLTAASLQAYFGGIHAAEQNRSDWWAAIAPGVTMPKPLEGATITGHDSPLNVAIDSQGGAVSSVTLTTTISVSGYNGGKYDQSVTLGVAGPVVTIRQWGMTHE
jgi:sortase A